MKYALFSLLLLSACATGRKLRLKQFDYKIGTDAKLSVDKIKRSEHKLQMKLLGISLGEDELILKNSDIRCGAGNQEFADVTFQNFEDGVIYFPKTTFKEFGVTCKSPNISEEANPYLIFRIKNKDVKIIFE